MYLFVRNPFILPTEIFLAMFFLKPAKWLIKTLSDTLYVHRNWRCVPPSVEETHKNVWDEPQLWSWDSHSTARVHRYFFITVTECKASYQIRARQTPAVRRVWLLINRLCLSGMCLSLYVSCFFRFFLRLVIKRSRARPSLNGDRACWWGCHLFSVAWP